MKKMKKELKAVDRLKAVFEQIAKDYPKGGYDHYVARLSKQRAEIANKIGRKGGAQ